MAARRRDEDLGTELLLADARERMTGAVRQVDALLASLHGRGDVPAREVRDQLLDMRTRLTGTRQEVDA
jgi:hypothetical protein